MRSLFLFFCAQALLIQNAFSTIIGPAVYGNGFGLGNSVGAGLTAAAAELAGWYGCNSPASYTADYGFRGYPERVEYGVARSGMLAPGPVYAPAPFSMGAYGGEGVGDIAVAGEMPVAGTTMVNAQVPILGAVRFAGDLPAGGIVTIAGSCGCGSRY